MKQNLFIVLDGLDGSGKGEMITKLHNYLYKKDKKVRILTTREPTYGKHGKKIRELLKKDISPEKNAETLLRLYTKDRSEHLKKTIMPFLKKNHSDESNIVLCDRYYYATIAYQSAQGIGKNIAISPNEGFLKPDIALILDLPAEIALKRIHGRKKAKEKFESMEFLEKVRKNFLELPYSLSDNIKIIDASKPKSEVFKQIKSEIEKTIN